MTKIYPVKPFLMMLYGYPGAGKTYFSRQFCENVQAAHLQADRIISELFEKPKYDKAENDIVIQLMNYMAEEFLSAGLSVVYDLNSSRTTQRSNLHAMAKRSHAEPILLWFQMDSDTAFGRNKQRDKRKTDDKYAQQLDRTYFDAAIARMQNPTTSENYAVISGKHLFNMQLSAVLSKLRSSSVLSLDDNDASSRVIKPGLVNLIPNQGRVDMTRRNISIR
jgi:predicted kinase